MEKRRKYLILALILTTIAFAATLFWQNVLEKMETILPSSAEASKRIQEIKINFEPLETSVFETLQLPQQIPPPEEGVGQRKSIHTLLSNP